MGARTNFEFRDAKGSIWLYSHWDGGNKTYVLANALYHSKIRWSNFDIPYAIRMTVSHIIGEDWFSELGYGLSSYEVGEESYSPISVDFVNQIVFYESKGYTFDGFIEKYLKS